MMSKTAGDEQAGERASNSIHGFVGLNQLKQTKMKAFDLKNETSATTAAMTP
jgi:hypothetical protein